MRTRTKVWITALLTSLPNSRAIWIVAAIAAACDGVMFAAEWDHLVGTSVRQVTDDAYVRGDITPLSAKVEGYVTHVAVNDFVQSCADTEALS